MDNEKGRSKVTISETEKDKEKDKEIAFAMWTSTLLVGGLPNDLDLIAEIAECV